MNLIPLVNIHNYMMSRRQEISVKFQLWAHVFGVHQWNERKHLIFHRNS
jgi:hypothetical protein